MHVLVDSTIHALTIMPAKELEQFFFAFARQVVDATDSCRALRIRWSVVVLYLAVILQKKLTLCKN